MPSNPDQHEIGEAFKQLFVEWWNLNAPANCDSSLVKDAQSFDNPAGYTPTLMFDEMFGKYILADTEGFVETAQNWGWFETEREDKVRMFKRDLDWSPTREFYTELNTELMGEPYEGLKHHYSAVMAARYFEAHPEFEHKYLYPQYHPGRDLPTADVVVQHESGVYALLEVINSVGDGQRLCNKHKRFGRAYDDVRILYIFTSRKLIGEWIDAVNRASTTGMYTIKIPADPDDGKKANYDIEDYYKRKLEQARDAPSNERGCLPHFKNLWTTMTFYKKMSPRTRWFETWP